MIRLVGILEIWYGSPFCDSGSGMDNNESIGAPWFTCGCYFPAALTGILASSTYAGARGTKGAEAINVTICEV